jgi:Domain of unknown function (DUF1918)
MTQPAAAQQDGQENGPIDEGGAIMRAGVGDHLIADGPDSRRVCEIIRLSHPDGSPPYVVRWLSDGHIALLFPGPYTRLVRHPGSSAQHNGR